MTCHCEWSTLPFSGFLGEGTEGTVQEGEAARVAGRDQSTRPEPPGLARQLGRGWVSSEDGGRGRGRARPRLRGACARVRPGGRPTRGEGRKGMDDGGWPRWGPCGSRMDPHATRRTLPRPRSGPRLLCLVTCCAVVRRGSPTASGEDARILCGGVFAVAPRKFQRLACLE